MIPFFTYLSREGKKKALEHEIHRLLSSELSECCRYVMSEALAHLWTGRYDLCLTCLSDVTAGENEYELSRLRANPLSALTSDRLARTLLYVEATPMVEFPVLA